jgi:hypothetical protein
MTPANTTRRAPGTCCHNSICKICVLPDRRARRRPRHPAGAARLRIVFVAAAGAHRKEAFRACEFLIDALRTLAPFWKKVTTTAGSRWVDAPEGS